MASRSFDDMQQPVEPGTDITEALNRLLRQTTVGSHPGDNAPAGQPETLPVPPLNWPPNLFADPAIWTPAAL